MDAVEFDFEALEAPVVVAAPTGGADAVMEAMAQAEAEAAARRVTAQRGGFAAGHAEALSALEPAHTALQDALVAVEAERVEAAERLERQAVELALMLAEKIVGGAIAVAPERVVESVRGALRAIVERERITVLVHPDDLELVREAMDGLRATLGGIEHCEVQAERRVARGGCLVRTPDGDVDARVETKLQRAREVVERALAA
jgi:flagellar assembly protein FliH